MKKLSKSYNFTQESGKVSLRKVISLEGKELDYPIFCFRHIQKNHNFDSFYSKMSLLQSCVQKIAMVSTLSWSAIQMTPKYGNGTEKIHRNSLLVSLPSGIMTEDISFLLSFHFSGNNGQIIGHRNGNIFHIFYIDIKHEVYKHS